MKLTIKEIWMPETCQQKLIGMRSRAPLSEILTSKIFQSLMKVFIRIVKILSQ